MRNLDAEQAAGTKVIVFGDLNFQHAGPVGSEGEFPRLYNRAALRIALTNRGFTDMWRSRFPQAQGNTFHLGQWESRIDGIWACPASEPAIWHVGLVGEETWGRIADHEGLVFDVSLDVSRSEANYALPPLGVAIKKACTKASQIHSQKPSRAARGGCSLGGNGDRPDRGNSSPSATCAK